MARRGENIYKRKDNRWEGRYVKGHDLSGKTQFGYVYAKTYREVREKLTEAKQMPQVKTTRAQMLLGQFCEEWLILCRNRVKASTYVKYHNIITKHIKPGLGKILPQKLDTVMVEQFSNTLLERGLSVKTVQDVLVVLKSVLKHCSRQFGGNFPEIELLYPKEYKKEMRVLSAEEQTAFMEYLLRDMDTVKFGVLLALVTGLRIGEVCALRWQDISAEEGVIHVTSTMQRLQTLDPEDMRKTCVHIGEAKSINARRTIPLTSYALSLCQKMRVADGNAFVLTGTANRYFEPRAMQYRLKKYTTACGLADVHFHVLRHTFATRCVEVGFELKSLSEILGHASTKVTLDRYVHSSMELKRANMEKLTAIGF